MTKEGENVRWVAGRGGDLGNRWEVVWPVYRWDGDEKEPEEDVKAGGIRFPFIHQKRRVARATRYPNLVRAVYGRKSRVWGVASVSIHSLAF